MIIVVITLGMFGLASVASADPPDISTQYQHCFFWATSVLAERLAEPALGNLIAWNYHIAVSTRSALVTGLVSIGGFDLEIDNYGSLMREKFELNIISPECEGEC